MHKKGITLLEVLAALVILGSSIVTLFYRGTESLDDVRDTLLMQEAIHLAEQTINEICHRGYRYYEQQEYLPDEEGLFEVTAEFTAEEILLPTLISGEEEQGLERDREDEESKEEKVVLLHISVNVSARDKKEISVRLSLDIPAETSDMEDIESILPLTPED